MSHAACPVLPHVRLNVLGLLLLTGCASLQPSYYENASRAGQNRMIAQGQAANNAAWVHASTAMLGDVPALSGSAFGSGSASGQRDLVADSGQRIYEEAVRTTTSALTGAVDRSIRQALR